jgi:hypothetical protein
MSELWDTCELQAILLVTSLCLSLIYGINKLSRLPSDGMRWALIMLTSIVLVLLFMNPPTNSDPTKPYKKVEKWVHVERWVHEGAKPIPWTMNSQYRPKLKENKLREWEVQKAFSEIQARIGYIDTWYHYKFVLVGGVMLAFITGYRDSLKGSLHQTVKSPAVGLLLASSCIIAFAADIHIRIEGAMTGMLGRWISEYVEPTRASSEPLYWETFLRTDQALHTSLITQFTFAPHLHFLTWPLYISFIWVFQEIAQEGRTENTSLIKGSFILVQTSLLIFVLVAHSTPLAYGLWVLDYPPGFALASFLFLYFLIVALSTPYFAIAGVKKSAMPARSGASN